MKLGPKVVAELAVPFRPSAYLRVMPKLHAATPLGMGFGQTRFSAPDNSFKVLYVARDIATAIAETIIRDRFEGRAKRILDLTEIDDWAFSEVSTTAPLTVLDLRTTGLLRLGVSTNAASHPPVNRANESSAKVNRVSSGGFVFFLTAAI